MDAISGCGIMARPWHRSWWIPRRFMSFFSVLGSVFHGNSSVRSLSLHISSSLPSRQSIRLLSISAWLSFGAILARIRRRGGGKCRPTLQNRTLEPVRQDLIRPCGLVHRFRRSAFPCPSGSHRSNRLSLPPGRVGGQGRGPFGAVYSACRDQQARNIVKFAFEADKGPHRRQCIRAVVAAVDG